MISQIYRQFAKRYLPFLLITVIAGLMAACGGGSSSGVGSDGSGTLQVRLTDALTDDVSAVNVTITSFMVKPSGQPPVEIPVAFNTVDLLTLQNTSVLLADASLAAGHYEYVMVELDENQSSVQEIGQINPTQLQIPSTEVKVLGTFDVLANGTTTIVLDFDAEASLIRVGEDWLLKPVIFMKDVQVASG